MAALALMVDINAQLSTLNCTLQGKDRLCHELYSTVSGFITKLCFLKTQIEHGTFTYFPSLFKHKDGGSNKEYNTINGDLTHKLKCRFNNIESCLPLMKIFSEPVDIDATNNC